MIAPFTNYDITLRILRPVHIGSGNLWLSGADFVVQKNEVCLLDRDRFYLDLDEREQRRYINLLSNGKLREVEKFILDETDFDSVISRRIPWMGGDGPKEIRTLIRGGANNEPYLPGSSIKGAMASAIFGYLYQHLKPRHYDKNINRELLGSFDQSIMRFFRPYDVALDKTEIQQIDLFNLYRDGSDWYSDYKTEGFSLYAETFGFEAEGTFRFGIGEGFAAFIKKQEQLHKKQLLPKHLSLILQEQPLEFLFKLINDHTRTHIQRELEFFNAYPEAQDHDIIIQTLEKMIAKTNAGSKSCVLRMGGGSGFHAITGDWRFADHRKTIEQPDKENLVYNYVERQLVPARYKSRKVTREFTEPMGFVELIAN